MNKAEFKKLIIEALENLPLRFRSKLENVEIVVEEDMPQGLTKRGVVLLGLYRGIPLKRRGIWYDVALPDKITIYKNTIEKMCKNETEIKRRIKDVLYHEVGHHFGLTEEQLR
jgi:predicted Zn-dependent protease with MMP-like domain